jgi:hypothetical protein
MSDHAAAWLAWLSCTITAVLLAGAVALAVVSEGFEAYLGLLAVDVLACALVGALVGWRKPANAVGWILLASAVCLALQEFAREYVTRGLASSPDTLLAPAMAWLLSWIYVPGLVLLLSFLPLYFPNGRLPSSGWRWVARSSVVLSVVMAFVAAWAPGEIKDTRVVNPLGVEALRPVFDLLDAVLFVTLTVVVFASVTSLLIRFRRSVGDERQQIKWLLYAAAALPGWFAVNPLLSAAFPALLGLVAFGLVDTFLLAGIPVAIGTAIFKYRLYDIDVLINRTLVYGSLTVSLALVYVGGVVGLQALLRAITGQESTLAVVASTLTIAALFGPLRRRLQAFVDRRFYREKYDAAIVFAAFNARLREETDLGALCDDLVGVAGETVQPEHVSLWLRPKTAPEGPPTD